MTENVYIVSVIVNCIFRKRRYSKFLVQEFQNVSVETSIRTSKFSKIIPSHSEQSGMHEGEGFKFHFWANFTTHFIHNKAQESKCLKVFTCLTKMWNTKT